MSFVNIFVNDLVNVLANHFVKVISLNQLNIISSSRLISYHPPLNIDQPSSRGMGRVQADD